MDINWQTDRSSIKAGETYLITEIAGGKREVFFEDSYEEKEKTFPCEYQLGEDNVVIAFVPLEDVVFDASKMRRDVPDDGDYHLVGIKTPDGSVLLNIDLYFCASGRWGTFSKDEIAGWFDWPEPYTGPILQDVSAKVWSQPDPEPGEGQNPQKNNHCRS